MALLPSVYRLWRRARRALSPARLYVVHHPDYARSLAGVPLDPLRGERILAFLVDQGLVRRRRVLAPRRASVEALLRVHTRDYLRDVTDPAVVSGLLGLEVDAGDAARVLDHQRLMTGGTVLAARTAVRTGVPAANLGGGLHHAASGRGMGFCAFNDVAVAVRHLRAHGFHAPVLVADLDLHDGNGTRAIFASDPTVHTFSIHNVPWEGEGDAVADTSIALGSGVEDGPYLDALRRELPPVVTSHRPAFALYVAGADPAADDALGDWRITSEGMVARDRFVLDLLLGGGTTVAVVLGGGYGSLAWRYAARTLAWLATGEALEPPGELEMALHRFRRARRGGEAGTGGSSRPWPDWELDEEDLVALGAGPARPPSRLLGRYSLQEVEGLLERAGVLEQLRALGFPEPAVVVEPATGLGEAVRIFGGRGKQHLLVELRVARGRGDVPGMEVLRIEWLLLQNPRARFPPGRPPLPGQEHPGLGILPDVVAWLALMAEDLGLDGVLFRSVHFHVIALASAHFRFLDAGDAARFRALREALEGVDLAEASRRVAAERVSGAGGDTVPWEDVAMVLPVSERLKRVLGEPPPPAGRKPRSPSR